MKAMKVLVTGSGGREHALAWRLAQSNNVSAVFVAPGNAGTRGEPKISNVDIDVMDTAGLIAFAQANDIGLTVIGPEAPLVAGVVDAFTAAGLTCFGPTRACAQLEGSKNFTKSFLARHNIPTAAYESFTDYDAAFSYCQRMGYPIVIKADGLAAGKGVVIAEDASVAEQTLKDMMQDHTFGEAGTRVVIEEFLEGEEATFIVIADGKDAIPFASSQDHKAAYDGDLGPNTGGMGAYSPAPVVDDETYKKIMTEVIEPTISGMAEDGTPYTGFLYAGLMIDRAGQPKVIEFNCRFGDPETQPMMMRMQSDLAELCLAAIEGNLAGKTILFDSRTALTVVMAAEGYPGSYEKGRVISGIGVETSDGKTFHAGTAEVNGQLVTNGGRVLGVTALGNSVKEAQQAAYERVAQIQYEGRQYRTDIGYRAVAREEANS